MRETLAMVLISPDFLYRVETAQGRERRLDDHALASRLSYFLWATMPDARLGALADEGKLADTETLAAEAERMLDDPRSWSFIEQFSDAWLDLEGVNRIAVNPNYYPDFDPALKADMRRETQHFFAEVLRKDLSALNLLRADFSLVNQPLAAHYGIRGPRGGSFERVSLAAAGRPGRTVKPSVHPAVELDRRRLASGRARGLGSPRVAQRPARAAPPPAVPNLAGAEDTVLLPLRRQLERHRDNAACAHCHRGIDPWGIALEEYDAVGLKRERILRRDGEREGAACGRFRRNPAGRPCGKRTRSAARLHAAQQKPRVRAAP